MKIYVMTHKKCDLPVAEGYVPLHVGRTLSQNLGYLEDNTGDNISDLNPLFGELTGLYWIWKNDTDSDIIGINHYRRFFADFDGNLLQKETVEKVMESYDVIAPIQMVGEDSHYETYKKVHNVKDMDAVRLAIEECYPEYVETFDRVMSTKEGYYGNLCVMKREVYMAYCEWLFTVLFRASREIDVTNYDAYHRRVYGFLSEPLLKVFIVYNDLKVQEMPVIYTSEKAETKELKLAVGQLIRLGQIEEADKMFHEFINYRPDVRLPASDISRELPIIELILYIIKMEKQYQVEGLYADTHELSELIDNVRFIKELIIIKSRGEEIDEAHIKRLEKLHVSEIAKQVIIQNLDY